MSGFEFGLWSFPVLLLLIFLRMPIGLAMFLVGAVGLSWYIGNPAIILSKLKSESYSTFSNYALSIIPMFLLMGNFASLGGMSRALFRAAESFLGHRRGGVAMATVGACAGFGAICGSSLATAATMGQVALPELRRAGYAGGFSTATLAAGGTLGILIPPSVILVVYATLAEQNIAKLFAAAFVPGILAAIGYMVAIALYARAHPDHVGQRPREPWYDRLRAVQSVWPVLLIFIVVIGGIYTGVFTPTEAAAIGAFGTGLLAWSGGALNARALGKVFMKTARSTGMIFFIILGAAIYNGFLGTTRMPQELAAWVSEQGYGPWTVLLLILLLYLVLGCVMDSLSMILLTVPIFFPIIAALDIGLSAEGQAIWFGILLLIVVEVGLITPPVGMNLFVINAMSPETPIAATYRAVAWFIVADILRVLILIAFPSITLFVLQFMQ